MSWKAMAGKYKVATIILGLVVLAVLVIITIAGIKSSTDEISFGEALTQMFGGVAEVAPEIGEEAGEVAGDVVETTACIM